MTATAHKHTTQQFFSEGAGCCEGRARRTAPRQPHAATVARSCMAGGARPRPHQVAPAQSEGEAKAHDDPADSESRPTASVDRVEREEEHNDQDPGSNDETPAGTIPLTRLPQSLRSGLRRMVTAYLPPRSAKSSGIEMHFPMFVMPIHKFLGLTELLPHQELRRMNMLMERKDSMETVIFVSHQWTSFDHPDHSGRQLKTLQRMFERMLTGEVPEVDAPFVDQSMFAGKVKVAPREWKSTLRDAYIWVDFAGVPQKEPTNTNDAASGSDGRYARRNEHKSERRTRMRAMFLASCVSYYLSLYRLACCTQP